MKTTKHNRMFIISWIFLLLGLTLFFLGCLLNYKEQMYEYSAYYYWRVCSEEAQILQNLGVVTSWISLIGILISCLFSK